MSGRPATFSVCADCLERPEVWKRSINGQRLHLLKCKCMSVPMVSTRRRRLARDWSSFVMSRLNAISKETPR